MPGALRTELDEVGIWLVHPLGNLTVTITDSTGVHLWAVVNDPVEPHAHAANPVMAQGSVLVSINGLPACLQGHAASCGHIAQTGAPQLLVAA